MTLNTEPAPAATAVPDCCAPGRAAFVPPVAPPAADADRRDDERG